MSLFTKIDEDLIAALKSGDTLKKETLRYLKSALKNSLINEGKTELTDEEVISIIQKEAKKRRESIAAYEQIGKTDLVQSEKNELAILDEYLPSQMSADEIGHKVSDYLANNPTTVDQMGQAMGKLSQELRGQADLGLVSKILREKITQ